MKNALLMLAAGLFIIGLAIAGYAQKTSSQPMFNFKREAENLPQRERVVVLKDVGEAYMDRFGLEVHDFRDIKEQGVTVIEGNFDICASDSDVKYFLDESNKAGLKVIMPAGSGEAEWGYECDGEPYPVSQIPVWQKDAVLAWVNKWKSHPAIYAWDISNEAGSVFPNNEDGIGKLTVAQLKSAYSDVKSADPGRPVIIRMNGWYFYDNDEVFFMEGNPFAENMANIAMVNTYSNVDEYFADFVPTVISRAKSAISEIDPDTDLIIALGVWQEPPLWQLPDIDNLGNEIESVRKHYDVLGIGFFKYGAKGSEWYLPDHPEVWNKLKLTGF